MNKNFLQDVKPPSHKRSIRDIPLPNGKPSNLNETQESNDDQYKTVVPKAPVGGDIKPPIKPPKPPRKTLDDFDFNEKPKGKKKRKVILAGLVLIIFAIFIFLSRSKAEIIVYPKSENFFVQNSYETFNKDLEDVSEGIGYKLLTIEKEAAVDVVATGEEEVSNKARGTIKIYNEYSSKAQTLVEKTRFETNKGLVYRITESVSVPGYTEKDGKIIPGSIEVEVVADEPGEKYNIGKTNFTIPGFDGLEQFDTMYAESTSDFNGGFVGVKKTVSEKDKEDSFANLKETAKSKINEEISNSGDDFVIIYNEENINYSDLTENDKNNGVELKLKATVKAYVFDSKELARFLVNNQIPNSPKGDVLIINKDVLTFDIVNVEDEESEEVIEKLRIEGEVSVEWIIDVENIKTELERKDKNKITEVLTSEKGIVKAESKISPIWKNSFPKASKIEILIQK